MEIFKKKVGSILLFVVAVFQGTGSMTEFNEAGCTIDP
jgi:hypothetical protein